MRDPKLDPRPGDVLAKTSKAGKKIERHVVEVDGYDIWYTDGKKTDRHLCFISTWMQWARAAEVVTRGEG
jgi:hypothetical protein